MPNSIPFTVKKNQLLDALKKMQIIAKTSRNIDSTLEVTLLVGFLHLVIPGVEFHIHSNTLGSAKFTINLKYFIDVVNSEKDKELSFMVEDSVLKLRGFKFNVLTTFFETDSILRSINLPINYTFLDIARLYLSEKFTTEEIEFNKLQSDVSFAINKVNNDIDKITSTMKKYGFSRAVVAEMILSKLKN